MNVVDRLRSNEEPDPRFSLANERTYLSWIRTSLGMIAAALALEAFGDQVIAPTARSVLVIVVLVIGALLSLGALVQWFRVQMALRARRPLPLPWLVPLIAAFFVGIVVALLVALQLP